MKLYPNLLDGKWPWRGTPNPILGLVLREMRRKNGEWGQQPILGFPSMSPHPIGSYAFNMFQRQHTNAILTHTRGRGEKGFSGVKELERDVIAMVGHLLGDANVDGYIAPGGTEANIMGLWIGRQKLRSEVLQPPNPAIAVLASPASHYSLWKACNLIDLGEGSWYECSTCVDWLHGEETATGFNPTQVKHYFHPDSAGGGLHLVRSNESGQIDVQALESVIRFLHQEKQVRRFVVFANEGTTMTGALDDTPAIGQLIAKLRAEWGKAVGFYLHVDAAYGGFMYPFLEPARTRALQVPEVDSVTIDPYKMGECPIAEGIFLCRKELQHFIQRPTGYVQDEFDDTLCGSRSGAYAAACWAVLRHEGGEGLTNLHLKAREDAQGLHKRLMDVPRIILLPQWLNMVAFTIPSDLPRELLQKIQAEVEQKYNVMWSWFNIDPENPDVHSVHIMKCNITRDVKPEWIDGFVETLTAILKT